MNIACPNIARAIAINDASEFRAIILAPNGRDAQVASSILGEAGFEAAICPALALLAREIARTAGFLVLAEEAVTTGDVQALSHALADQPPWSDLPIILLMRRLGGLERNPSAQRLMALLGNVSFIERPFHPTTLVSAARAARRARQRQYQARAFMQEQAAAAERLRASEEGRRLAIEAAQIGTWHYFPRTGRFDCDARCRDLLGLGGEATPDFQAMLRAVHVEDRTEVSNAFDRAAVLAGGAPLAMEYRTFAGGGPAMGGERWVAVNGRRHSAVGEDARIAGTVRDVTTRRRAEEQRRLLVNELDHRVKNTLATIQSIARQTLTVATDLESRRAFEGRLLALSQAHNVLTREHWGSARLHDIVANTFEPYGTPADGIFRVNGPNIRLSPRAALALALALHELATNAAKYGALSVSTGSVGVRWRLDPAELPTRLCLSWAEAGGPPVQPPRRKGFGSRLIERGLSMEIDGKVKLDFRPRGVRCRIEVPLTALGGAHD